MNMNFPFPLAQSKHILFGSSSNFTLHKRGKTRLQVDEADGRTRMRKRQIGFSLNVSCDCVAECVKCLHLCV